MFMVNGESQVFQSLFASLQISVSDRQTDTNCQISPGNSQTDTLYELLKTCQYLYLKTDKYIF